MLLNSSASMNRVYILFSTEENKSSKTRLNDLKFVYGDLFFSYLRAGFEEVTIEGFAKRMKIPLRSGNTVLKLCSSILDEYFEDYPLEC